MTATLVMTDAIEASISEVARQPLETAAVMLVRLAEVDSHIRLLVREIHWVDPVHYLRRASDGLSVASSGYVHSLGKAEATGCTPLWFHTHPGIGSDPRSSPHDDVVDSQITDLFRLRSTSSHYGSLIVAPREGGIAFTGFIEDADGRTLVDRVWTVGNRLRLTWRNGARAEGLSPQFDRNVRAFGPAVQETLANLRITIVGCGGTGSAVAEQLVRLGSRNLNLIDPDTLSDSNVTRVYGSRPGLVGQPKVIVLKNHLSSIAPDAVISATQDVITSRKTASHLLASDVVFGCTDDNAGRLVLSRFSTYFLTPVIDCGVLLTSDADGTLNGIDGRVTTLVPGQACLVCRDRIDLARAASEALGQEERRRRIDEGYAPALLGIEPAVITFTTAVGAFAVSELLERLIGFGPVPRPSEVLLRGHEREISTNTCQPRRDHYCDSTAGKMGLGLTDPLLDLTWPD
jgi:molybdopterin/thiamine biosynthesis adenylyltransferase